MKLVTLKATNLELTPAIEKYLEEKMGPLEKYLAEAGEPHNLYVELAKTTRHHKNGPFFYAEADIVVPRAHLRAESEAEDLYSAIDGLQKEIKRQLGTLKDKKRAKVRKAQKITVRGA